MLEPEPELEPKLEPEPEPELGQPTQQAQQALEGGLLPSAGNPLGLLMEAPPTQAGSEVSAEAYDALGAQYVETKRLPSFQPDCRLLPACSRAIDQKLSLIHTKYISVISVNFAITATLPPTRMWWLHTNSTDC
eukprot:COSAG01_NODE_2700_length_7232_cov_3.028876_6_plen_134_part_00